MIKIENVEVNGWRAAIQGMRNPMNSWARSDTDFDMCVENDAVMDYFDIPEIGENDHALMLKLAKAGAEHAKYLRMITVYCDITAPLYWWKEMDTYKVGTVSASCSTMHTLHKRPLTLDDFSHEHLNLGKNINECVIYPYRAQGYYGAWDSKYVLEVTIQMINRAREVYEVTNDKAYWWQMIQLLPSSYNQRRTMMFSYQTLANIYRQRKGHRLTEWTDFCDWVETLPYSELITGERNE